MNACKLGVCEIAVCINEDDGPDLVNHAIDMMREWVDEIGAQQGDYAAVWDATTESWVCFHELEAEDTAEELLDIMREHGMKIKDKLVVARPLIGAES